MMYQLGSSIPKDKGVWVIRNMDDILGGKHPEYTFSAQMVRGKLLSENPLKFGESLEVLVVNFSK